MATLATGCKKKKKAGEGGGGSGSGTSAGPGPGSGSGTGPGTESPTPSPTAAPDPAVIARGAYLATSVAGCAMCHTAIGPTGPMLDKAFAGGLEFPEDFGTWRSPNITQDKKTGIGDWTDEQIATAIREGKRPNGDQLIPMMPYMRFSQLSDDDTKAIVAFLRTLPAIENAVKGNADLQIPKPPAPPLAHAAPGPDPLAQGKYLMNLMLCGDCHTPMGPQGPDMSKEFAGGLTWKTWPPGFGEGTMVSPNITSDSETGIGDWSEEQIATVLTQGKKIDDTAIGPPMMFLIPLWAKMTPTDIANVAKAVKAIPAIVNKTEKSNFKMAAPPPGGPPPGAPPPPGTPKG